MVGLAISSDQDGEPRPQDDPRDVSTQSLGETLLARDIAEIYNPIIEKFRCPTPACEYYYDNIAECQRYV